MSSPYHNAILMEFPEGDSLLLPVESVSTGIYTVHTVKPGQTLQNIAYAYFGDSGLWDKIAYVNNILNPFTEVVPGMKLLIPNL